MTEPRKLPKPTVYDQLYPGRFLKAAELLGKKVTLTISDVDLEELEGDDGKRVKAIVSLKETEKKLVLCKTNGMCLREMFGKQIAGWIGKRITLFEDQWNGEPATRIWGSPDIAADLEVDIALPRRRPFKKTMHRAVIASRANAGATTAKAAGAAPDTRRAIEQLQATLSLDAFAQARRSVWAAYAAAATEVPMDVEAAAFDHEQALEQAQTA